MRAWPTFSSHQTQPSVAHRCRRNSASCRFGREKTGPGTNFSWLRRPNSPSELEPGSDGVTPAVGQVERRRQAQRGAPGRRMIVADRR